MTSKRKSCPVKKREFLELDTFNKNDKTTYDGTETVRELNKFDRKWFGENSIAVVATGKTFYGRTFVVPYIDIDGERYWFVDKEKKEKKTQLDINKILNNKSIKIISSEEALKDVISFEWSNEILNGEKKSCCRQII